MSINPGYLGQVIKIEFDIIIFLVHCFISKLLYLYHLNYVEMQFDIYMVSQLCRYCVAEVWYSIILWSVVNLHRL
jgi:hypothetical protein